MLGDYGTSEDTLSFDDETVLVGPSVQKLTQLAIEAVHGASANIHLSQFPVEAVHGGTPNIRFSQNVIEVVHGASANIHLSQFVIELVVSRRRSVGGWGQVVGL